MSNNKPLFVAPSSAWTGEQTFAAFAESIGRVAKANGDGTFSFVDGNKRYRVTLFKSGTGWVFGVIED